MPLKENRINKETLKISRYRKISLQEPGQWEPRALVSRSISSLTSFISVCFSWYLKEDWILTSVLSSNLYRQCTPLLPVLKTDYSHVPPPDIPSLWTNSQKKSQFQNQTKYYSKQWINNIYWEVLVLLKRTTQSL